MTARGPQSPDPEDRLVDALKRPVASPRDLSRPVMGRLGYMWGSRGAVRRARRRRLLSRSAVAIGLLAVAGLGFIAFQHGPQARRPVGATVPAALGQDLQDHRHRFDHVISTFRERTRRINLEPAAPLRSPESEPADPAPLDEDVDRSAVGPVRWL